jgi:hypothetical protein
MARKQGSGNQHGVEGLYLREYRRQQEMAQKPDPRLWPVETGWPSDPAEMQKLIDASPCAQAARRRLADMDAGEPIEVATLSLSRQERAAIPWLSDANVRSILVGPDDRVTPEYH